VYALDGIGRTGGRFLFCLVGYAAAAPTLGIDPDDDVGIVVSIRRNLRIKTQAESALLLYRTTFYLYVFPRQIVRTDRRSGSWRFRKRAHVVKSRRRHPCMQPSACNTNSDVVCSTHTMLSQVLTCHCDIVSAHGSVRRNQLSRATAARPVTHIHHRTSLFAACIIRNRYGDAP